MTIDSRAFALAEQLTRPNDSAAENSRSTGSQAGGDSSGLNEESRSEVRLPPFRSPRIPRCDRKRCRCSCHANESSTWKCLFVRYTPLDAVLRSCDQSTCSARRYQFLRVQLLWLGIPVAVQLGGEFITGAAGYALRPSLQVHAVVRATSPGFEVLFRLEQGELDTETAKEKFRQLYRSDSTLRTHVNPVGQTYAQELVHYGPWGVHGYQSQKQLEMIEFFVQELNMGAGMDTDECATAS